MIMVFVGQRPGFFNLGLLESILTPDVDLGMEDIARLFHLPQVQNVAQVEVPPEVQEELLREASGGNTSGGSNSGGYHPRHRLRKKPFSYLALFQIHPSWTLKVELPFPLFCFFVKTARNVHANVAEVATQA